MRRIIVANLVTLDGFLAGSQGEIDWHLWNEETAQYAKNQMESVDTILFGRKTYDLMAGFWPTPAAASEDPVITDFMNETFKIVYSKTLEKPNWKNTKVLKEIDPDEILKMKKQSGKNLIIFGSGTIVSTLTNFDLIDDYEIFLHPLVLGRGQPHFTGLHSRLSLKIIDTKRFSNGVVLLHYRPDSKEPKRGSDD